MIKILIVFSLIFFGLLGSAAYGQQPTPTPVPTPLYGLGEENPKLLKLSRTTLKEELVTSEVEPRTKRFKMNVRFVRANYTHRELASGSVGQQQYDWYYFPEVSVSLAFYRYPFGSFSIKSPADALAKVAQLADADFERTKATKLSEKDITIGTVPGKEYEVSLNETKMKVRTFTDQDVRYVLIAQPKTKDAGPLIDKLFNSFEFVIPETGNSIENGLFVSKGGKFSIAIPQLPKQTLDQAKGKALDESIDVGKTFLWIFEKTLYTIYYNPPIIPDGTLTPQVYADIENGTRKGALNGGATITSEKPISYGKYRGTEFHYELSNGVKYIGRVYLIGDMGYQVVGAYADSAHEKEVLGVLDSFKPLINQP